MKIPTLPALPSFPRGPLVRFRRTVSQACQRAFWSRTPLTLAAAQRIVRKVDAGARLTRRYASETHQVFQAAFRGTPAIVKFAGVDFRCKFILRGEVARLRRLCEAGAPVPEFLFGAERRLSHPFFISRDVGAVPRTEWTEEVHRRCSDFEAALIQGFGATVSSAGLPVMKLEASRESLVGSMLWTESGLQEFAIIRPEFGAATAAMRIEMDRYPWTLGALQPPEPIFDGRRFWAVDWDPARYVPPLKWVCDYTYFIQVCDPGLAWRYAARLADALELRLTEADLRAALTPWYRFKALEMGVFLLKKYNRWDYFRRLQRTFFGAVLADAEASPIPQFRRSFAG